MLSQIMIVQPTFKWAFFIETCWTFWHMGENRCRELCPCSHDDGQTSWHTYRVTQEGSQLGTRIQRCLMATQERIPREGELYYMSICLFCFVLHYLGWLSTDLHDYLHDHDSVRLPQHWFMGLTTFSINAKWLHPGMCSWTRVTGSEFFL